MDDVLVKALKRRKILEDELKELNTFIHTFRKLSGTESEESEPVNSGDMARTDSPLVAVIRRHGRPSQFVRYLEGVLKDVKGPLPRAALVAELESRGIEIPSDDKPRYIGTIMWRERKKFINIVGHGYWLKYVPLPEILYDPAALGPGLDEAHNITLPDEGVFL